MPYALMSKQCIECGRVWQTRKKESVTCSPKCRAIMREKQTPSKGAPRKEYPKSLVDQVGKLYASGMTIEEVATETGTSSKVIWRLMERNGIDRRQAVPRPGRWTGENASQWRGGEAGYQALHLRVETARGKPQRCSCCDTTDQSARYEWANLSGHYDDVNDYARLCVPCHRKLDARRRKQLGRPTSPQGGDEDV